MVETISDPAVSALGSLRRELAKGIELAERVAGNAPLSNFAIMHALPRIAETHPASGLFTESLMASVASNSDDAKTRLKDFLEKRGRKVLRE